MHISKLVAALLAAGLMTVVAATGPPLATGTSPSPDRAAPTGGGGPDIVVFMLDDVPQLDGRLWRYLPNIRRTFIQQGVRFNEMYGESPLCCPGRAGWLTGQHTFNHGVDENDVRLLDPSETLATELDAEGYETFLSGKYFNQYDAIAPAVPPGWDHFHGMSGGYYDYTIWNDGDPDGEEHGSQPADYSTDVIGRKALDHLAHAPRSRSLFAWIAPFATHGPNSPPPRYRNDAACATIAPWSPPNYNELNVSDKPGYVQARSLLGAPGYDLVAECRALRAVDDLVGAVTAELDHQGRLEDTLMILTSDNGMNYGAHRLNGKVTPYATQVPFFMSWPNRLGTEPRAIRERLSNIDLAPTICDLAGCSMGPYPNGQTRPDGRSFARLLLGLDDSMDRDALLEDMPDGGKLVPPWYALATTRQSPWSRVGCSSAAAGGCRWHYVEYGTGERELYDVSNGPCWTWRKGEPGDPCELRNLAGDPDYAALQAALSARLRRLKSEFGGPGTGG